MHRKPRIVKQEVLELKNKHPSINELKKITINFILKKNASQQFHIKH